LSSFGLLDLALEEVTEDATPNTTGVESVGHESIEALLENVSIWAFNVNELAVITVTNFGVLALTILLSLELVQAVSKITVGFLETETLKGNLSGLKLFLDVAPLSHQVGGTI